MTRNYLSGSIKKALAIIECIGKSTRPLKASEVANISKLEKGMRFLNCGITSLALKTGPATSCGKKVT